MGLASPLYGQLLLYMVRVSCIFTPDIWKVPEKTEKYVFGGNVKLLFVNIALHSSLTFFISTFNNGFYFRFSSYIVWNTCRLFVFLYNIFKLAAKN